MEASAIMATWVCLNWMSFTIPRTYGHAIAPEALILNHLHYSGGHFPAYGSRVCDLAIYLPKADIWVTVVETAPDQRCVLSDNLLFLVEPRACLNNKMPCF